MESDLTELSKEELIRHIEILNHNINVSYKDQCENYVSKDKIRDIKKAIEWRRNQEIEDIGVSFLGSAIDVLEKLLKEE